MSYGRGNYGGDRDRNRSNYQGGRDDNRYGRSQYDDPQRGFSSHEGGRSRGDKRPREEDYYGGQQDYYGGQTKRGRDDRYDDRSSNYGYGREESRGYDFAGSSSSSYRGHEGGRDRDRGFDRNRDFDRGGRGSGRFGSSGGRGGRGFGGRGERKTPMGEVPEIANAIQRHPLMQDSEILKIIDPPYEERDREQMLECNVSEAGTTIFSNPKLDEWRIKDQIGIELDNRTQIVRANFFRVNPRRFPEFLYLYKIGIFKVVGNEVQEVDLTTGADKKEKDNLLPILKALFSKNQDWMLTSQNKRVGFAYDGGQLCYTTYNLPEISYSRNYVEVIIYPPQSKNEYSVHLTLVAEIPIPRTQNEWKQLKGDVRAIQALDVALMSFSKWQESTTSSAWLTQNSKAFKLDVDNTIDFQHPVLTGRYGYFASLKRCMSGVAMVCEISVGCFLKGGNLIELMAGVGGYRSVQDMVNESERYSANHEDGLPPQVLDRITTALKNCKIKLLHLGYSKKLKEFGPKSTSHQIAFESENGELITVAEYFRRQSRVNSKYKELRYPTLPTLVFGSKKHQTYTPAELIYVEEGQMRNKNVPSEITANIIKVAAVQPQDRFRRLTDDSLKHGLFGEMIRDANSQAFGLSAVSTIPMKVQASILPPPKLKYGNKVIEPGLRGTWNLAGGVTFAEPAPCEQSSLPYGLILVYQSNPQQSAQPQFDKFRQDLEHESGIVNMRIRLVGKAQYVRANAQDIQREMENFQRLGARIVVVVLHIDVYPLIKSAGDSLRMPTQCVKWSNFMKPPKNYNTSLLIKMNYKMGGINHTLASRASSLGHQDMDSFQSPPKSISWLFDEPCMVVGLDINHGERKAKAKETASTASTAEQSSVAAIVASMDGKLGQYGAYITTCAGDTDILDADLKKGFGALLDAFYRRNNQHPRRIIVFRDGVAESQFEDVLNKELRAFKEAISERGMNPMDMPLSIVICQKRHHTRLVYQLQQSSNSPEMDLINPCVGLCVDGRKAVNQSVSDDCDADDVGYINSEEYFEFYLNSHAASLGTSKPTKYILLYDEIGFKLSELELLTFWTTHLYGRCTKSVSYPTPAYYAHWAARRGKVLVNTGLTKEELEENSRAWLEDNHSSMYFI